MLVRVTATHPASGTSTDLAVRGEPDASTGSFLDAVARHVGLPVDPGGHVYVGATLLDREATLLDSAIVDGVELAYGTPRGYPERPFEQYPSLRVVSGPGAGTIAFVGAGTVTIGSAPASTLRLAGSAPATAAVVTIDAGGATLTPVADVEITLDGIPIAEPHGLVPGRPVGIGDALVEYAPAVRHDAAITRSESDLALEYARPPRLLPPDPAATFRKPTPPVESPRRPLPIIAALLPLVVSVGLVVFTRNVTFLAFAALSPVMLVANWMSDRKFRAKSFRQRMREHEELTRKLEADVSAALEAERGDRRMRHPDAAELAEIAIGPRSRLWERRIDHEDFLSVRLGTADMPSTVAIEDPSELEHRRRTTRVIPDSPFPLDLRALGVVGIAGTAPDAQRLAAWLLGQLAVLHSPRDLEATVLTSSYAGPRWFWTRWLPHALTKDGVVRIGASADTLGRRAAEVIQLIEARQAEAREQSGRKLLFPGVIVIVDGARRLRALPGLSRILREGPAVGVVSICVDADRRLLPEECNAVVTVAGPRLEVTVNRTAEVADVRADLPDDAWFDHVARSLAPIVDVGADAAGESLPASSRLLDVLDLDPPTPTAILARWRSRGRSTQVVVGESLDGAFSFDLREDGPHGLIAGTTGAGKSELLQSIIASLATANRPDAMNFVLVDYKGGAAFKDCVDLPHTVGMVTDLDTHLVERALTSLGAELRRREHLLAAAGAKDIEDYVDLTRGDPTAVPLPRLLIVIDEFASLARELPDFVTGLVNIAQRGRSLGIHLILATQRPSGVVSPEIRANTNLRIALRVTDSAESKDVIDAPDAATISKSTPGRAYIRLGATSLLPFQAGRVGGRRVERGVAGSSPLLVDEIVWSTCGTPLPEPAATTGSGSAADTDLVAIVAALREAAESAGMRAPHRPWLDALPPVLLLDDVNGFTLPAAPEGDTWSLRPIPYGLQDLPAAQEQRVASLDLDSDGHLFVVGAARSGRSQTLRTIAAAIASNASAADVHLHAIDCGNGALVPLRELPHAGVIALRNETERAARLLERLTDELARRQEVLSAGGFGSILEQRSASAPEERLPHIVLLLDRWEGFLLTFGELDGGTLVDRIMQLLREGAGAGIHVLASGDRQLLTGRVASLVETKLVLRLSDRADFSYAGLNQKQLPDEIPDGRAFTSESGIETQIAVLAEDTSGRAQAAALATIAAAATARDAGIPAARRAFRLDTLPASMTFDEAWDLPRPALEAGRRFALVGIGGDELAPQGPVFDASGATFLVSGPPRSGRSTLLLSMARSLLEQGASVVLVTPKPSPLRALEGTRGVLAVLSTSEVGEDELAALLPDDAPDRFLVIDDAELVKDAPAKTWLARLARTAGTTGRGLIIAGAAGEVAAGLSGWQIDLKRGRRGALLSPSSITDGDLIGARLSKGLLTAKATPGRAVLGLDGEVSVVQVPTP